MSLRRFISFAMVVIFAAALVAACGKAQTPTEGFKAFYEAAKNKDAAGLKKTISKRMLAELEKQAKSEGKEFDAFLIDVDAPPAMPEVRNEKIEGETATLEIKGARGDTWRSTKFVKEDGLWKLDSD